MTTSFFTLYVSRVVPLPVSHVAQAFDRLPTLISRGSRVLVLDRRSEARDTEYLAGPARCVRATLRPGGLRGSFRVAVEATPWSHDRTEIAIRPEEKRCSRHPARFCDAAHAVIDSLTAPLLTDVLREAKAAETPQHSRLGCMVRETDATTVVKLAGDLDHGTVAHLRDELAAPLATSPKHVRVDLADLRSVDDVGLAAFVLLTRTVERDCDGTSVIFASPPEPIRQVIERSGLSELISVE